MVKKKNGPVTSGKKNEKKVYNICSKVKFKGSKTPFCNYSILGGSTNGPDITCNKDNKNVHIEVKAGEKNPSWGQFTIRPRPKKKRYKYVMSPNGTNKIRKERKQRQKWTPAKKNSKVARKVVDLINKNKNILFGGQIPPFYKKKITHEKWKKMKKKSNHFKNVYMDCDPNLISEYYSVEKGCDYIHSIKGLHYLKKDICNFEVPLFLPKQVTMIIRNKVHKSKNKQGFMVASVTVSLIPKDFRKMEKSPFSLDNFNSLPKNLFKI